MSTLQTNNYLIYEVLYKGKVVYIGSGLPDRYSIYISTRLSVSNCARILLNYLEDSNA